MYTPPRPPTVSTLLPATRPNQRQNCSSTATATGSSAKAAAVMAAGDFRVGSMLSSAQLVLYSNNRPAPLRMVSALTCSSSVINRAQICASRTLPSGRSTCPPSPGKAFQWLSPRPIRVPTPSPVPGPITTLGLSGSAMPWHTVRYSSSRSRVMPSAMAVKSLTSSRLSTFRCAQKPARLMRQWLLVNWNSSPFTGPATDRHTVPTSPGCRSRSSR